MNNQINRRKEEMNAMCDKIIEQLKGILEKKQNDFQRQKNIGARESAEEATMTLFDIQSIQSSIDELYRLKEDIDRLQISLQQDKERG